MVSQNVSHPAVGSAEHSSARAMVMVGSVLALLGAITVFGWSFLNWDDSPREVITGPGEIVGCILATAGSILLILGLPRVLVGVAAWAIAASVIGLAFVLVDTWYHATVAVALANELNDATFDAIYESGWVFLFSLPKMLLCLMGFVGVAVSGWRTGLISRPLCVLLAVGGVVSLVPPFMPGVLVSSIAFLLIAHASRGR